jgi:uncharacterized membrane protein
MWECEVSVEIEAPIERVYERLADLRRHSEFSVGLSSVEQVTPGPVAVGTRFTAQERIPGKYVSHSELTALERPRLIAWKAWVPHVMRTEWEFRLTPAGDGTRLVQVSRWAATGPVGLVMLNLHRKRNVPAENRRTLEKIKATLEAGSHRMSEVTR